MSRWGSHGPHYKPPQFHIIERKLTRSIEDRLTLAEWVVTLATVGFIFAVMTFGPRVIYWVGVNWMGRTP